MSEALLEFSYEMQSEFDQAIEGHQFRLMCFPAEDRRQKVVSLDYEIRPHTWISEGRDSFGNRFVYGLAAARHTTFSVRVRGTAETGCADFEDREENLAELFRYPTPATMPGEQAARYFGGLRKRADMTARPRAAVGVFPDLPPVPVWPELPGTDSYAAAVYLMNRVYEDFTYQSGVSDTTTTSEQTFVRRAGVCQDLAHVLITLCRMEGIAARYVAGILEGEGETHAWAEVLAGGKWYGLDPTHDRAVDGRYLKLSHGRDCRDCLVNRGIYFNQARETQKIRAHAGIKNLQK